MLVEKATSRAVDFFLCAPCHNGEPLLVKSMKSTVNINNINTTVLYRTVPRTNIASGIDVNDQQDHDLS